MGTAHALLPHRQPSPAHGLGPIPMQWLSSWGQVVELSRVAWLARAPQPRARCVGER
ncbi:hypothetical protein [Tepidimonas sp.]|uniref:hypothetical protein n=1 Tax=Tepidimonas sp. TaxID=2002775 RepID=UPI00405519F1